MNILYLHSHDTGRCLGPYGHGVATPAFAALARRGVLFRRAFAVASSCSASRASLQTGQYPHQNGMTGLAHRGWRLFDYDRHIVNHLRRVGYRSALIGEHHIAPDADEIGYDEVVVDSSRKSDAIASATEGWLASPPPEPWFLSCGFWETHRTSFTADSARLDGRYVGTLPTLPDRRDLRRDAAAFDDALERLDAGVGRVLDALERSAAARRTLVVATTDHAPGFPGWKATLTDRGLGVYLVLSGPGVSVGREVDALVSQIDIFPTLCEAAGAPLPAGVEGRSLWPLLRGDSEELHAAVFGEANYHAAREPQRTIRTNRHRFIRRFDGRSSSVLANIDDGITKDWVVREHPGLLHVAERQLYDLDEDPRELQNLIDEPAARALGGDLERRLLEWMADTDDPLLEGRVPTFPESVAASPDALSATEPAASVSE